ncbi:MAG TPA: hypothetical protein PKM98_11910, partial [Chitinophagaceae bacterium]|nr:hypothetical protein [Chitinophagaceae bacterium]
TRLPYVLGEYSCLGNKRLTEIHTPALYWCCTKPPVARSLVCRYYFGSWFEKSDENDRKKGPASWRRPVPK